MCQRRHQRLRLPPPTPNLRWDSSGEGKPDEGSGPPLPRYSWLEEREAVIPEFVVGDHVRLPQPFEGLLRDCSHQDVVVVTLPLLADPGAAGVLLTAHDRYLKLGERLPVAQDVIAELPSFPVSVQRWRRCRSRRRT
eukprot:GHVU01182130.1.p1 GENE.GHVU01182130.1~~GHVU01182130.1.p1  ORF type:complete len:137 (-),score=11.25 GHVU01182130.1:225-635(-)